MLTVKTEEAVYHVSPSGVEAKMVVVGPDGLPTPMRCFVTREALMAEIAKGEEMQTALAVLATDAILAQAIQMFGAE